MAVVDLAAAVAGAAAHGSTSLVAGTVVAHNGRLAITIGGALVPARWLAHVVDARVGSTVLVAVSQASVGQASVIVLGTLAGAPPTTTPDTPLRVMRQGTSLPSAGTTIVPALTMGTWVAGARGSGDVLQGTDSLNRRYAGAIGYGDQLRALGDVRVIRAVLTLGGRSQVGDSTTPLVLGLGLSADGYITSIPSTTQVATLTVLPSTTWPAQAELPAALLPDLPQAGSIALTGTQTGGVTGPGTGTLTITWRRSNK